MIRFILIGNRPLDWIIFSKILFVLRFFIIFTCKMLLSLTTPDKCFTKFINANSPLIGHYVFQSINVNGTFDKLFNFATIRIACSGSLLKVQTRMVYVYDSVMANLRPNYAK